MRSVAICSPLESSLRYDRFEQISVEISRVGCFVPKPRGVVQLDMCSSLECGANLSNDEAHPSRTLPATQSLGADRFFPACTVQHILDMSPAFVWRSRRPLHYSHAALRLAKLMQHMLSMSEA